MVRLRQEIGFQPLIFCIEHRVQEAWSIPLADRQFARKRMGQAVDHCFKLGAVTLSEPLSLKTIICFS